MMASRRAHLARPRHDLAAPPHVPGGVNFDQDLWRAAPPMDGQEARHGSFHWDVPVTSKSKLTDPEHATLLHHLKVFAWTLLYDPREAKATTPGGLTHMQGMFQAGARWMVSEGWTNFSRMGDKASRRFLHHFLDTHARSLRSNLGRPPELSHSSASNCLRFVKLLHRQRKALKERGILVPDEKPFGGQSIYALVTQDLDLQPGEKLEPLSDNVAVALIVAAEHLINTPADDVIALQRQCINIDGYGYDRKTPRRGEISFYDRSNEVIRDFAFSTLPGEDAPWTSLEQPYVRKLRDGRTGKIDGRQAVRRLIMTINAAAVVLIQGCSGVRASDMASFEDTNQGGLIPSCVTTRLSDDGMLDLFYCHGVELKGSKERHEWLIGSRLAGSNYLPIPVRAFSVLHELFAPWRALGESKKLFVTFGASQGLPREKGSVGRATSRFLTLAQKDFLRERCDLDRLDAADVERFIELDELRGHLWRTTFATFMYRIDPRLLGSISRHFGHLRSALTEAQYIGNDTELLDLLDSSAAQESSRFFYDALEGNIAVVGRLAEALQDFPVEKGSAFEAFELAVTEEDLRLINMDYGVCGVNIEPEASRCNVLGGTQGWAKRSPNSAFRDLTTCLGCKVFAASSYHLPFWTDRRARLQASIAAARACGEPVPRVLMRRLAIARRMAALLSE